MSNDALLDVLRSNGDLNTINDAGEIYPSRTQSVLSLAKVDPKTGERTYPAGYRESISLNDINTESSNNQQPKGKTFVIKPYYCGNNNGLTMPLCITYLSYLENKNYVNNIVIDPDVANICRDIVLVILSVADDIRCDVMYVDRKSVV